MRLQSSLGRDSPTPLHEWVAPTAPLTSLSHRAFSARSPSSVNEYPPPLVDAWALTGLESTCSKGSCMHRLARWSNGCPETAAWLAVKRGFSRRCSRQRAGDAGDDAGVLPDALLSLGGRDRPWQHAKTCHRWAVRFLVRRAVEVAQSLTLRARLAARFADIEGHGSHERWTREVEMPCSRPKRSNSASRDWYWLMSVWRTCLICWRGRSREGA
jgi:hypothetical protein